jgi:DNA/RNA-binding domain of Phe-tRNA-synthetase-like protein
MTDAVSLDISEVVGSFPRFRVALVVSEGLIIPAERPPALAAFVEDTTAQVAKDLAGVELADIAELKAWRQAYRAFGVKKTSYRSSVERLLKNLQRGAGLPCVNALVDAYNAVSARYRMPIGADDLDRVRPPLAFRYARSGDTFVALGDPALTPDPPNAGEVVYADAEKCLCRRWNWYQDARSAIGPRTSRAALTVQTLSDDDAQLRKAAAHLIELIAECGGRARWAIAHEAVPCIALTDA